MGKRYGKRLFLWSALNSWCVIFRLRIILTILFSFKEFFCPSLFFFSGSSYCNLWQGWLRDHQELQPHHQCASLCGLSAGYPKRHTSAAAVLPPGRPPGFWCKYCPTYVTVGHNIWHKYEGLYNSFFIQWTCFYVWIPKAFLNILNND